MKAQRCDAFDHLGRRCMRSRHLVGAHKFTLTRAEETILDQTASEEVRKHAVRQWLREIGSAR